MAKTEEFDRPFSFVLVIVYKLIAGVSEISTGVLLGLFGRQFASYYHNFELTHETVDPSLYVRTIERAVPFLLDHRSYVIVFLLTFGFGKIIGAIGLWYEKLWAIHLMVVLSCLLVPFELVDFVHKPSLLKVFYIVMNIAIVIYLTHFNPHVKQVIARQRKK